MDGANNDGVPDFFAASPFSEPYPLSREEIVAVQPSVPWTDHLDYLLSGLVRKYRFDFHRISRSFRKYVEVILCELDEENLDPNHYSEEACRLRWSLLDFEEFQRRKIVTQELITMRTLRGPWFQKSATLPDSDLRNFHTEMAVECDSSTTTRKTAETELHSQSHGTASSVTHDVFVDDKKFSSESPHSSDSVPPALKSDLSCPKVHKDSDKSSKLSTVSTKHQKFLSTSEESDTVARSFDVQIDPTPSPAQTHPNSSVTIPQKNPRQLSELERSVLDEGLEISDFTIFSHDLKTQFEGFYNEVRGALPAMRDSGSSSSDEEDDEKVEPVFSNLRVDEKTGEYVGHIAGLVPINVASNSTPSLAGAASIASLSASLTQSVVSGPAAVFECKQVTLQKPKTQADISSPRPTEHCEHVLSHSVLLEKDNAPALESTEDTALAADWCRERAEGRLCVGRGDDAGAVAHLSRAISSAEASGVVGAGTLVEMWQERAESLMAMQHYAEAAEDWRRLILAMERERGGGVTANVAKARLQLAISLRFTGKYVDAAHEVEKVLQVEPENQMAR